MTPKAHLVALFAVAVACTTVAATHPSAIYLQAKIEAEIVRFNGTFPEIPRLGAVPSPDGGISIEYGTFEYSTPDGSIFEAYYALPESARTSSTPLPAILISHQWLGISDDEQRKALGIATDLGYVAFALDLYGKGRRFNPGPRALAASLEIINDRPRTRVRLQAAWDALVDNFPVDAGRVGAQGYCLGGSSVLEMLRMGLPIKVVSAFHGSPYGPFDDSIANEISAEAWVQVHHAGADDDGLYKDFPEVEQELKHLEVAQLTNYKGVAHGFAMDYMGTRDDRATIPAEASMFALYRLAFDNVGGMLKTGCGKDSYVDAAHNCH